MTTTRAFAALSEDSYRTDRRADPNVAVEIDGVRYRVLATSDKESGYQGTVYQRLDTREIIVAHRGTEPGREFFRDALKTDGGMVINAANNQAEDAKALTRWAVDYARAEGERTGRRPTVEVTGHSLGGTLAQITAHEFGLKGETFNAYGAASLKGGPPEGGNNVVNHVRATDVVSAGSPHYGSVRVYATKEDIDALKEGGYRNDRSQWDVRNPLEVAWNRAGPAHSMGAFLRNEEGGPLLTQDNLRRAQQEDPRIDKFRDDVGAIRAGITGTSQGVQDGWDRIRRGWNDLFSQNGTLDPSQAPLVSGNRMVAQTYDALDRNQIAAIESRAVAGVIPTAMQGNLGEIRSAAVGNNALFVGNTAELSSPTARIASQPLDRLPTLAESSERAANLQNQQTTQVAHAPQVREIEPPQHQPTMRA